jgi:hypothetical protein
LMLTTAVEEPLLLRGADTGSVVTVAEPSTG